MKNDLNYYPRRVLLVRMAPFNTTPAIPRMVSLLKKGGTKINILAVDRYNEHEPNEEYEGCNVFWYKKPYTSGNKISFLSTWINWWIWVIGHLFKRQYDIVHRSEERRVGKEC